MHPYFVFDGAPIDSPITTGMDPLKAGGVWPRAVVEYKVSLWLCLLSLGGATAECGNTIAFSG
jgi:hypothetical protein